MQEIEAPDEDGEDAEQAAEQYLGEMGLQSCPEVTAKEPAGASRARPRL